MATLAARHAARVKRITGAVWPSFSVVIPTWQRRDIVCDAVRSLCRLAYDGDIEAIVVVDGSTDGTASALGQIECPFRLRVIEQANSGASEARNRGAKEARNEIILFLDDDMICDPDLLREHGRMHREGADAVIGDTPIDPGSTPGFLAESVGRWVSTSHVQSPLSPFDIFTGQLSVRRSVFWDLGGFDAAFTTGIAFGNEDADFGARLLARYEVRHNPAAISRQVYVVSPREYMDRAPRAVAADLRFISKHPDLAWPLFEAKMINSPLTKWVYLPLSYIPFVSDVLASTAVRVAEVTLQTRFRSNRLVARFFSGARSVAYWSALRKSNWYPFATSLLVLCYHAIQDQSDDPVLAEFGVPPKLFVEQLETLTRRGFTFVTPDQLVALITSKSPLPRRSVLLTFDDGYASLVQVARQVLQPRGIEAIAFVVTGMTSRTNEWDQAFGAKEVPLLSAEQMREVAAMGIEFGSHSSVHGELPLMGDEERAAEIHRSSDELEAIGLPRPRFFAYPFGHVDEASKRTVSEAGYFAAFGLRQYPARRNSDRFDIPRVIIVSTDRGWRFRLKIDVPRLVSWAKWGRSLLDAGLRRASA